MKILLDENLPRKLKNDFGPEHEVRTVREMGWNGKRNGELLGLTVFNGFDALVTVDKNMRHQQNLERFRIIIFLLSAVSNKRTTLQPLIQKVNERIKQGNLQTINEIN